MEGEIMDKNIVEINCKSKNILQLWNWIYQLNKKNLNQYSTNCRNFAITLFDFIKGNDNAFEKLSGGFYYPHLDLEAVRKGFRTLLNFYQYCNVKYCHEKSFRNTNIYNNNTTYNIIYNSNLTKRQLNEMLNKPDEIYLDIWVLEKIIQMLFVLEKSKQSILQVHCILFTESDEERKQREISERRWYRNIKKDLEKTRVNLSDNYQRKDLSELLEEIKKYIKSEHNFQKYFRKFSQSSNKETQIYQLKIMLASYYFYNTSKKSLSTSTMDILKLIEETTDFEELRMVYTKDYKAFKNLVLGFQRFYQENGKAVYLKLASQIKYPSIRKTYQRKFTQERGMINE